MANIFDLNEALKTTMEVAAGRMQKSQDRNEARMMFLLQWKINELQEVQQATRKMQEQADAIMLQGKLNILAEATKQKHKKELDNIAFKRDLALEEIRQKFTEKENKLQRESSEANTARTTAASETQWNENIVYPGDDPAMKGKVGGAWFVNGVIAPNTWVETGGTAKELTPAQIKTMLSTDVEYSRLQAKLDQNDKIIKDALIEKAKVGGTGFFADALDSLIIAARNDSATAVEKMKAIQDEMFNTKPDTLDPFDPF